MYISVLFSEIFRVYALSAAFRNGRTNAETTWQGVDIPDRDGRGTGVAIINPLTDDYLYQKFDTVLDDAVSVNVVWCLL